jgi:hypothetical protein
MAISNEEFASLASAVARIAWELCDNEALSESAQDEFLGIWQEFEHYSRTNE